MDGAAVPDDEADAYDREASTTSSARQTAETRASDAIDLSELENCAIGAICGTADTTLLQSDKKQ